MEILVAAGLIAFFLIVRLTLSVEKPNPAQQIAEMIHEGVGSLSGTDDRSRIRALPGVRHLHRPLHSVQQSDRSAVGLIPGVETPTGMPEVPLGIAVLTFLYYNFHGLRVQGPIGYLKHFAGPIWWMAPLMFPIEIVSHLARMMSLTIRLYANMFASDMLTLVFFSLIPLAIPAIFLGLHVVGFGHSGIRLHAAGDDLSVDGGGARALDSDSWSVSAFQLHERSIPGILAFRPLIS